MQGLQTPDCLQGAAHVPGTGLQVGVGSAGGEGVKGLRRSGRAAAAGWGSAGTQLASISSSAGTGRDARPDPAPATAPAARSASPAGRGALRAAAAPRPQCQLPRETLPPTGQLHGHPTSYCQCPHDGLGGWARVARPLPSPVLAPVPSFPDPAASQSWSGAGHGAPATASSIYPQLQLWDVVGGYCSSTASLQCCCYWFELGGLSLCTSNCPSMPVLCLPSHSSRYLAQEMW